MRSRKLALSRSERTAGTRVERHMFLTQTNWLSMGSKDRNLCPCPPSHSRRDSRIELHIYVVVNADRLAAPRGCAKSRLFFVDSFHRSHDRSNAQPSLESSVTFCCYRVVIIASSRVGHILVVRCNGKVHVSHFGLCVCVHPGFHLTFS